MTEPKWYAVRTKPSQEAKAAEFLRRQGYVVWYPFTRQKLFFGKVRAMREVDRPFFSRYIFVCFTRFSDNHHAVKETWGVSDVVRIGDNDPLEIPAPVISELMELTDEQGLIHARKKQHWFTGRPGDALELKDEAPFYGLLVNLASVADLEKKDEITVWMQLLGATREVTIPVASVKGIMAA